MIISHKHKFLFIGLPFSASSAITKELHSKYAGRPLLRKHSLYHEFWKIASKEEKKYFTFAVLRNPMDIVVTIYEKMKSDAKKNFNNPELLKQNGGHISIKQQEAYRFIQNNNASFQEFFLKFFILPYDNYASITMNKCDFVIRYENIESDYLQALEKCGINDPKPLPVANKTIGKNKNMNDYYTKDIQQRASFIFGPFLKKHGYNIPSHWPTNNFSKSSSFLFNCLGFIRNIKWHYEKISKRKSIQGSIYGDIQRQEEEENNN